jgi:hypothetical protein
MLLLDPSAGDDWSIAVQQVIIWVGMYPRDLGYVTEGMQDTKIPLMGLTLSYHLKL